MRRSIPLVLAVLVVTLSDAPVHAQIPVTDVATTLRNATTAATKELLLRLQAQQHSELRRMAHRLSMFTSLDKYAVREVPLWRIHDFEDAEAFLFARPYHAALNYGDDAGLGYGQVARTRMEAASALGSLAPSARQAIERMLATLDIADSMMVKNTHQTGQLRYNGRREIQAIAALERHAIDPSQLQSATAVADKISGATLIAARQRQARLQLVTALLEQLLVENKRSRDSEAVGMNMQITHLLDGRRVDQAFTEGAAEALRRWRQP
jgi:hypothetical protein